MLAICIAYFKKTPPKVTRFMKNLKNSPRSKKSFVLHTLQIFIVILLCKSIKFMGKMYKLMIGKLFCKNYHWNPGIVKQFIKPSKNRSQYWLELLSASNRFWYEGKIEKIGINLQKLWNLSFIGTWKMFALVEIKVFVCNFNKLWW